MDPVEGGPLRPPSNEVARAWARAQISRGRSARSELGARGDALVVRTRCPVRSTVTLGCQSYRVLRLTGGRSCRMYAYQTEEEEIWPASWRPAEAARSRKGCCARRASLRNLLHSRACLLEAGVSSAKSSAAITVYCNDKQYQATSGLKRPLIMPPRRSHRSFPTQRLRRQGRQVATELNRRTVTRSTARQLLSHGLEGRLGLPQGRAILGQ